MVMEDKVRVVFYYFMHENDVEPTRLCGFYTTCFGEWIKMLHLCKEYKVPFNVREDDSSICQEHIELLKGLEPLVEDYWISFGSDECIQCIEVLLK